jgi:hypothetical protein
MTDDDLFDRLHASDPAASLPPADPERVARLLEDVMSTELTTENRETGTHGRGPLTWLVAAAAVMIIAGVGLFAVLNHDEDPAAPPTAKDTTLTEPTVTELTAPDTAQPARCMVPNAEVLAQQSVAFDGTVTGIEGGVVTLAPATWYAGEPTDLVRIQAPSQEVAELLPVNFEEGGRYLVSATDGVMTVCGFSAAYSAELAALYEQAFPG